MPKTGKESQAAGGYRITRGCFEDGESFVLSDYWKASRRPSRSLEKRWRGSTEFVEGPGQESGAPNSVARWLTPRSPGNSRPEEKEQTVQEANPEEDEAEGFARGPSMDSDSGK